MKYITHLMNTLQILHQTEIELFLSNTDGFHSQSHFPFALWTDWYHQEGQQVDREFYRDCALVCMVTLDVMS